MTKPKKSKPRECTQSTSEVPQDELSTGDAPTNCITREQLHRIWHHETTPLVYDPRLDELAKKIEEIHFSVLMNYFNQHKQFPIQDIVMSLAFQDEEVKKMIDVRDESIPKTRLPDPARWLIMDSLKKSGELLLMIEQRLKNRVPLDRGGPSTSRQGSSDTSSVIVEPVEQDPPPSNSTTPSDTSKINQDLGSSQAPPISSERSSLPIVPPIPSASTQSQLKNGEGASSTEVDRNKLVPFCIEYWKKQALHLAHDPMLNKLSQMFQKAVFNHLKLETKVCPEELTQLMENVARQDETVQKMISEGKERIKNGLPVKIHEMITDHLQLMTNFFGKIIRKDFKLSFDGDAKPSSLPRPSTMSSEQRSATLEAQIRHKLSSNTTMIFTTPTFVRNVWNSQPTTPSYDPKFAKLAEKLQCAMIKQIINGMNSTSTSDRDFFKELCSIGAQDEVTNQMREEWIEPHTGLPKSIYNLVVMHYNNIKPFYMKVREEIEMVEKYTDDLLKLPLSLIRDICHQNRQVVDSKLKELMVEATEPREDEEPVMAKPKPMSKKQPPEAFSSTTSMKPLTTCPLVKPPKLSRRTLKLLGKTREIKARNYRPDGPYKKYRSPKRALAPHEQEESAACKKCWRMSKRLMINRKKRRNARRRITELERSSIIENSLLEQKLKKMEEHLKEKDRKIVELEGIPKIDEKLIQKIADLERKLKDSQEKVRKLEMKQKESENFVKPITSSSSSQTTSPENKSLPELREQEEAKIHPDQAEYNNKMMEEMCSMREMIELNHKEIGNFKRAPSSPTVSDEAVTISLLEKQNDKLVDQSAKQVLELRVLKLELEELRRSEAVKGVTIIKHEETITELVAKLSRRASEQ